MEDGVNRTEQVNKTIFAGFFKEEDKGGEILLTSCFVLDMLII